MHIILLMVNLKKDQLDIEELIIKVFVKKIILSDDTRQIIAYIELTKARGSRWFTVMEMLKRTRTNGKLGDWLKRQNVGSWEEWRLNALRDDEKDDAQSPSHEGFKEIQFAIQWKFAGGDDWFDLKAFCDHFPIDASTVTVEYIMDKVGDEWHLNVCACLARISCVLVF